MFIFRNVSNVANPSLGWLTSYDSTVIATIRLKITTASQLFQTPEVLLQAAPAVPGTEGIREDYEVPLHFEYCDDLELRQVIEKQLNKGEGANKFSKAVSFGHSHEFIQGEKEDQEIAEACRRLIKNAIVCWNYLYLSRILAEEKNEKPRAALIEAIRNGSVATWAHFNLHGEFDFSEERMVDSIGLTPPKNPSLELG
jgi:hypothetical protein